MLMPVNASCPAASKIEEVEVRIKEVETENSLM